MSSQRSDHGICVSKERCLAILTEDIQDLLPEEKKDRLRKSCKSSII